MTFWLKFLFILIFFFIPLEIPPAAATPHSFSIGHMNNTFFLLRKSENEEHLFDILTKNSDLSVQTIPLIYPFIDDSRKGMLINYDQKGNFSLFTHGHFLDFQQQENTPALLPKIAYPFILMISKQRDFVKIYEVQNSELVFKAQYFFSNIITSYATSENQRYLAIGTLSSEIIIFDANNQFQDPRVVGLKSFQPGVYGVGITNMGTYFAIAGHAPSFLVYGNIETHNISSVELSISIPARTQTFLRTKNLIFIPGNHNLQALEIREEKHFSHSSISHLRPYPIVDIKSIEDKKMVFLYRLSDKEYIVDIFDTRKWVLMKKIHIITDSIPIFSSISIENQAIPIIMSDTKGWIL